MELTEYQSKQVLVELGIGIPEGFLARSDEEAAALAEQLMPSRLVLKAQIQAGGRALGYFIDKHNGSSAAAVDSSRAESGVRFVDTADEVREHSHRMLGRTLVTEQTGALGQPVNRVYIEKFVEIIDELYIAFTVDAQTGEVVCLASKAGGVSVEAQAVADNRISRAGTASGIQRFPFDIATFDNNGSDALDPVFTQIGECLSDSPGHQDALTQLATSLFELFISRDATLIELNPFGFTPDGNLVVLDASIIWDDNSVFRQGHREELEANETLSRAEHDARVAGLNYHDLNGNIGCLSNGAGLAMATNDAITTCGGVPGNFLDVPPSVTSEQLTEGLRILFANSRFDVVLVNVFGGGVMRCGTVSKVMRDLVKAMPVEEVPPVVVRLAGVESDEAIQELRQIGTPFHCYTDLESAAQHSVALADEQRKLKNPDNKSGGMMARLQSILGGRKSTETPGGTPEDADTTTVTQTTKTTVTDVDSR